MEWLWLCLALIGLGLLWLMIIGLEKLMQKLKEHDEARRLSARSVAERTAEAEADFMRHESAKARAKAQAKDYLENADFGDAENPEHAEALREAIDTLSTEEFTEAMARRIMGAPQSTESISATQSAFAQTPVRKVVAKGEGVAPVKVKSGSGKSALSKSEQKMLKKIKQGD